MNKKSNFLFFICLALFKISFAQVSVDPFSGAANVNIPIYAVRSGQTVVPVSLSYYGSGTKLKDVEGTAGMGWQLNLGQISRIVRGIPDDVTKDNKGDQRLGWMSSLDTAANSISGFSITNNGSTCSYETADMSYITGHFPFRNDTEPDQFYVSAPGLSCELIFERSSGTFKPVNFQDLKITYAADPTSHQITSFTITNDKGITYVFGASRNTVTMQTALFTGSSAPSYYGNKYYQYINGITYSDSWSLTNISDVNGSGINLSYEIPSTSRPSTDTLALSTQGTTFFQYYVSQTNTPYELQTIQAYNANGSATQSLTFNWTSSPTGQVIISSITGFGHNYQFGYSGVTFTSTGFVREFLRTFSDPGTSTPVNYQFAYAGETKSGTSYTTALPDSTQNQFDYWGYYSTTPTGTNRIPTINVNPSTPSYPLYSVAGTDTYYTYTLSYTSRTVDATNIMAGSLIKITSAQGGNSNIIYEPNDFYNVPSATVIKGGGIRVKQIIDSTGVHSTNNVIRNYSYLNPSTGVSSGKPISLPQYAFAIQGSGTGLTIYSTGTIIATHNLSNEDNSIIYAYSKESQTGAGSTQYQYYVPATYWDASATPDCNGCTTPEWAPTINYLGREYCGTETYTPMSNAIYSYPFISNGNYDFERGLPVKITSYNDSGSEVSESNYTYQRSYSPTILYGVKNENYFQSLSLNAICYSKYPVFYYTGELTTKVVKKVYDSQGAGQIHADSVTYTYGSANHKLVTQEQSTNSDGSTVTTKINYTKDYTAVSGSNANVTAVYNLQQENINVPVESYKQITHAGVTKTTSASLTLFKGVTPGITTLYLPYRQYKLIQPNGLSSFSPMAISGQVLTYDSTDYVRVANYDVYDKTGFPVTTDDNFKHIGTTLIHHFANKPIAIFSNAAYGEVAFSDFDSDQFSSPFGFTITGSGSYTPVGSHAGNAAGMASTQTATSPTLTKNAVALNYIFSIWINATTAGTLTLTLTGISTHPTLSYLTGGWQYYEVKIPVGTLSSSYTVSFTASNNISMDDILFYPDVAQATTATYDPVSYHKLAETNTNGVSSYFTSDQWGRVTYAYDQDHNIVQKNSYVVAGEVKDYSNISITGPTTVTGEVPASFGIQGVDVSSGATVTWTFGDGTSPVNTALTTSPSHTYAGPGTYTITAVVNSPLFGPKTITKSQVVNPGNISLTYSDNQAGGTGSLSSLTFSQGGVTKYSFYNYQINGATILQGTYTVVATIANPESRTDYSFSLNADCWYGCNNYTATTTLTFTYTATLGTCTTLGVLMSSSHCTGGGE